MKHLRQYIRRILIEAIDPIKVKTVAPENYDPPAWSTSGPRTSENPQKRVGNFFMSRASDGMPSRGFGALRKLKNFYMILPDGEAIRIDNFKGDPSS